MVLIAFVAAAVTRRHAECGSQVRVGQVPVWQPLKHALDVYAVRIRAHHIETLPPLFIGAPNFGFVSR